MTNAAHSQADVVPLRPLPLDVLIVDDNDGNRLFASKLLSALGMRTSQADSGPQALRFLDDHACDVVFLDVHMPVMDGLHTARTLLSRGVIRPRLVAMTAFDTPQQRQQCEDIGMDGFLPKPFRMSLLRTFLLQTTVIPVLEDQPLQDVGRDGLMAMKPMLEQLLLQIPRHTQRICAGDVELCRWLRAEVGMLGGRQFAERLLAAEHRLRAGLPTDEAVVHGAASSFTAAVRMLWTRTL
jgi:CheY-like chemotaxis protein